MPSIKVASQLGPVSERKFFDYGCGTSSVGHMMNSLQILNVLHLSQANVLLGKHLILKKILKYCRKTLTKRSGIDVPNVLAVYADAPCSWHVQPHEYFDQRALSGTVFTYKRQLLIGGYIKSYIS